MNSEPAKVGGGGNLVFAPLIAGKIYVFLLAIALYSGVIRYLSFHTGKERISYTSAAFILTFNLHFLMSYLNFLTGFALILHAIVFIRQRKYESHHIIIGVIILGCLLYTSDAADE